VLELSNIAAEALESIDEGMAWREQKRLDELKNRK